MPPTLLFKTLLTALSLFISLNTFAFLPDSSKTKTDILTEKSWKYQSTLEIRNAAGEWVVKPDSGAKCHDDDILIFHSDGTYQINSGKIKCSIEEDIYNKGNWQLSIYGTMLKLDGYTLKISLLTKSILQLIRSSGKYEERWTLIRDKEQLYCSVLNQEIEAPAFTSYVFFTRVLLQRLCDTTAASRFLCQSNYSAQRVQQPSF